jgi:hypothetical protein
MMEGTRRVGRFPIMWLDSAEQGLRTFQIMNWKKKVLERTQWTDNVQAVKDCNRLQNLSCIR